MKKRVARIMAVLMVFAMGVGSIRGQTVMDGGKDAKAITEEKYWVWDIDQPGPGRDMPFNKELHPDRLQAARDTYEYICNLKGERQDYYKATHDLGIADDLRALINEPGMIRTLDARGQNNIWDSLADYYNIREHGLFMDSKSSFYYGIRATENLDLEKGQKGKVKVEGAPRTYEKNIWSGEYTNGLHTKIENYAYFARPVWKSSNPSIATVDENGNVRAKKKGKTKITVSYAIWSTTGKAKFNKDGSKMLKYKTGNHWVDMDDTDFNNVLDFIYEGYRYHVKRTCNVTVR